jgi:gliding motility-associated-like protein
MKLKLSLFIFLYSVFVFSQGIAVDVTTYSNQQLVRNVLLGNNDCINSSNFSSSSPLSVGYFNKATSGLSLNEGIIIRSGLAKNTEGQYTGANTSTQVNTTSDTNLQQLSNNSGQTDPITDVGFLQFDFIPISNQFSFDFVFASNEYGQYQCGFSDAFAFLLTNLSTGVTTNLAVIPGTSLPVSVKTIRNQANNPGCTSSYPIFFSKYNVTNPSNSDLNMRGVTTVLNASSAVVPNVNYRIRLVIGDYKDSNFDSAVLIKGGSFTTTLDIGPDQNICQGNSVDLRTNLNPPFTHVWSLNGTVIPGATSNTYAATQAGTYSVTASSGTCVLTDTVVLNNLVVNNPPDIASCYNGAALNSFNLSQNSTAVLGISNTVYSLEYYNDINDANTQSNAIPLSQLSSYQSVGSETIYIKIKKIADNTFCDALYQFNLVEKPQINLEAPYTVNYCESDLPVNLTLQNATILNGLPAANYSLSFFTTATDSQNNSNAITNATAYSNLPVGVSTTIYVRANDTSLPGCFGTSSFSIFINPSPLVDTVAPVIECSSYALQPLTNGSYYTQTGGPSGTGTLITLPYTVTNGTTIYVFSGPTATGCTNETNFTVTFIDEFVIPPTGCGNYVIPSAPAGNFYSAAGGLGTLYPAGTILNTSQTIYFYAVINTVVCRDEAIPIVIYPLPILLPISNVVVCSSYTLPAPSVGNYYTNAGGTGTLLPAGTVISANTATLPNSTVVPVTMPLTTYNYYFDGQCSNEVSFTVSVVNTALYTAVTSCPYVLPAITFGGYYSQPQGQGPLLNPAAVISTSQAVYYYAATTDGSYCTDNLKYDITINPNPTIDAPANVTSCGSYYLQPLTNGDYYFLPNGQGGIIPAYTEIASTRTVYVYKNNGTCVNENSFVITIKTPVSLDGYPDDKYVCTVSYQLPVLTLGKYFTGANGTGTELPAGTAISANTRIYIYNGVLPDATYCPAEHFFDVYINYVSVGTFTAINACDSYTLPTLTTGNYFNDPNGVNPISPSQYTTTIANSPRTVYVYASKGDVPRNCFDEQSFVITVSATPVADNPDDVEACGSYTLPPLSANNNYFTQSNGQGTAYLAGDQITASQTLYVFSANAANSNCKSENAFDIKINPLLTLNVSNGIICVDYLTGIAQGTYTIQSGLNPAEFTVNWFFNGVQVGTGSNYVATEPGNYTIKTVKLQPESGLNCNYNDTVVLIDKSSTAIADVLVSDYFENSTLASVINLNGFGDYLYQVDGIAYQSSSVFNDLSSGDHIMYIKDIKNNCGVTAIPFKIVNYPKFFTPNGDGYNDTWNVFDLSFKPQSKISIFDRFGKLIKQIETGAQGWDGTLNGKDLPSTDYWFVLDYEINGEPKQLKGHFAMKR